MFGLEEDVERLKRDKKVLMQELVRLRQQQQAVGCKLWVANCRAICSSNGAATATPCKGHAKPGFLNQLVQQNNESNRLGGTKKRRLPGQEEENLAVKPDSNSPNGQIVKFHSSMNEAAKAMLHQILKMNSSSRLEPSINNSGPFLIGFSVSHPCNAISEVQSPSCAVTDCVKTDHISEMKMHNSGQDAALPNFAGRQGIVLESSIEIPNTKFANS
ncbi:hypothetical protein GH714_020794 [Hevea brasiliensis]|uniref:Uncharacterized protein n=1 Tax=Hevea brasiliensis TaxID=3981 RepID=A0A6A6M1P7_HEVBR|nr:hypothetical protein GH714_020794 [Hevea brasiliensis]